MDMYFAGAEIQGWRNLLADEGVTHVSLSYMGLRRRSKLTRPYLLAEKFQDGQHIFVDSGAYTLNSADEEKYSQEELVELANSYYAFVHLNLDRIEMVSEFDCLSLGREWIEDAREDFWDDLPPEKFLPIWHAEWGLEELDRLARQYERVGVTQTDLGGRNLTPILNNLVQSYGVKLHAVAMTRPDEMRAVRWSSTASTSWLSPSRYGDTIVWTPSGLKRYPKKYKDQARLRHRTLFESAGFDAEKIANDDPTEVLRLSIWSWRQLAADIERHRATNVPSSYTQQNAEIASGVVATPDPEMRNSGTTLKLRPDEERSNLPVLGFFTTTAGEATDGDENGALPTSRSQSLRMCNSCFLAAKCPAMEPDSNCAYDIPIQIRTRGQMRALTDTLIEWQTQRVAFMKMSEDMEGGYADPNLTNEIKTLQHLIDRRVEMDQEGFSINIEAKAKGQAGVLSRLFGEKAGDTSSALPRVVDTQVAIEDILDAEIVDIPGR